jgi:hypothetical protein
MMKTITMKKNFHCPAGSIFLMALIFHIPLSETTIKLLHILRRVLSAFCISYLQSTMALVELIIRILSIVSVLVPGALAELFNIPCTDDAIPFLHSPVETS